jgi:hypothetical protein
MLGSERFCLQVQDSANAITPGGLMTAEIAPGPITPFYSYSHKDESLRQELANHLMTLQRAGFIREWHDRQILGGEEWTNRLASTSKEPKSQGAKTK